MTGISKFFYNIFLPQPATDAAPAPEPQANPDTPDTQSTPDAQAAPAPQATSDTQPAADTPAQPAPVQSTDAQPAPAPQATSDTQPAADTPAQPAPQDADQIIEAFKALVKEDDNVLAALKPEIWRYVRKHTSFGAIFEYAAPTSDLEVKYRDLTNPLGGLLDDEQVIKLIKDEHRNGDAEAVKQYRFRKVLCYEDGTPASPEDVLAWEEKKPKKTSSRKTKKNPPADKTGGGT